MRFKGFFLGLAAAVCLTACTSEDIEVGGGSRPVSSGALKIEVTAEDGGNGASTRTSYSMDDGIIKATFVEGDQIGVFAVNGTTVVASNICFTRNSAGDWTPATEVAFNPDYYYYAYYPYTASPGAFNNASAPDAESDDTDTKMSTIISGWTVAADQSSISNYRNSDLLAARGVQQSIPVVKFTMKHKMAMAQLVPSYNKFYYAYDPTTMYNMEVAYSTNIPYTFEGNAYYIMKPGSANSVGGVSFTAGELTAGKLLYRRIGSISGSAYTLSYSTDGGSSWSSTCPTWLAVDRNTSEAYSTFSVGFGSTGNGGGSTGTAISSWTAPASVAEYDLSLHDVNGNATGRNTANSYMVHKSGTYLFPLVYGNAIKDGATNTAAFNPGGSTSSTYLAQFVNHNGSPITDPWLKNNGATPDAVELLWQDSQNIIESVSLDGDYVRFTVKANAPMGNAVIAAKKSGVVAWSWHIWCCPDVYTSKTQTTVNTGSHIYTLTPMNLGWVGDFSATDYTGGTCKVKVTPTGSGSEQIFSVTLPTCTQYIPTSHGYQPYFQFGRKDPEIPSNAISSSSAGNKTVYNVSNSSVTGLTHVTFTSEGSSESIVSGIQHPTTHYFNNIEDHAGRYSPFIEYYYNLWDAYQTGTNNITTATVKTIYDPCPPGYCVPTGNLYNYIGGKGESTTYSKWCDAYNSSTMYGRFWIYDFPHIYFPASGLRLSSNGATLDYISTYGDCWGSSVSSGSYARFLSLNSSSLGWNSGSRAFGFPVRPVVEE